ncbi:MAG: c(7)-type cytochrome triheme domain-containing protein [Parvularculaceae bacterium]
MQAFRTFLGDRNNRPWWALLCLVLLQCQANVIQPPAPTLSPALKTIQAEKSSAVAREEIPWKPLAKDHVHDPSNDLISFLQEPAEALSALPRAEQPGGNHVNWVAALEDGTITPRAKIQPSTEIRVLDKEIIMPNTSGMPKVVFPHRQHTEWLDCSNCHDKIFKAKAGANDFGMLEILQGDYCGQCHGAVSFPLTQCLRCHSLDHDEE